MKAIAVIPARLASTRLTRKALREIAGQPMVGRVYEAARGSPLLADVIIATDSDEIMAACQRHGWKAQMTSTGHRSGTERVHEIANLVAADIYLNVQGDEPLTRAEHIASLLEVMNDPTVEVGTLKTPAPKEDIPNPNAVKVVTDHNWEGTLLFPGHHSTRSRPYPTALFQASGILCVSQICVGSFCRSARILARTQRAAGATTFFGKRDLDPCRRDSFRYGWRRY